MLGIVNGQEASAWSDDLLSGVISRAMHRHYQFILLIASVYCPVYYKAEEVGSITGECVDKGLVC